MNLDRASRRRASRSPAFRCASSAPAPRPRAWCDPRLNVARIDIHATCIPDEYRACFQRLARRLAVPASAVRRSRADGTMDRYAIDAAVMSTGPPGRLVGDCGRGGRVGARRQRASAADRGGRIRRASPGSRCCRCPTSSARWPSSRTRSTCSASTASRCSRTSTASTSAIRRWDAAVRRARPARRLRVPAPAAAAVPPPLARAPIWLYEFPFDTTRAVVNLIYSRHARALSRTSASSSRTSAARRRSSPTGSRRSPIASPRRRRRRPAGALAYLRRLYYDTGLSNNAPALASTLEVASRSTASSSAPTGPTPRSRRAAIRRPSSDSIPAAARAVDAANAIALVPRLPPRR